jgi:hypothetical protein
VECDSFDLDFSEAQHIVGLSSRRSVMATAATEHGPAASNLSDRFGVSRTLRFF